MVLGLLLAGFVFSLATYNLYPTVWADEVLWSEPAINLVETGRFTTSVWQFQRAGSFWAAQSPLYCFGLAGWMKLFGTDLLAARSFNFALISLGTYLTWLVSWRCRVISRPILRILVVPLLLCGYGMSFSYRCSRPDIAGMVCLLCLGLAFFIHQQKRQLGAVFLCAFVAPWIGIQVALYVGVCCLLAKLFFQRATWWLCIASATGVVLGLVTMLGFYHFHGVLTDLMASISQAAQENEHWGGVNSYDSSIPFRLGLTLAAYKSDMSSAALLAGWVVLGSLHARDFFKMRNGGNLFLASIILTVPLVFSLTGHFAFYYSYMIYIPLVLLFLSTLELAASSGPPVRWSTGAGIAAAVAACAVGLPLRLLISKKLCQIVPRAEYASVIQSALAPDDVVFADYPAFFECKSVASLVYSPMYSRHFVDLSPAAQDFTEDEKRRVTVLAIPPTKFDDMKSYWGGEWVAVTPPLGDSLLSNNLSTFPFVGKRLLSYLSSPQSIRQPIQVFRRSATASY